MDHGSLRLFVASSPVAKIYTSAAIHPQLIEMHVVCCRHKTCSRSASTLENYKQGECMKTRFRHALAAGMFAALAGILGTAEATIIFEFHSTCTDNCSAIGLNAGDAVSGAVGIADGAVVPGGSVQTADVTSLDLHFGTFTFGLATLGLFEGVLNATASAFDTYYFVTSAPGSEPGYAVLDTLWIAGPAASNAAGGPGAPLVRATVPEPATMVLVGLGLAGLAAGRRRRQ